MMTATKLWLGFGTLIALMVLSSAAIIVRVRSIEGQVGELANVATSRSAAARQLEINILGYSLAVRTHFQSDDPKVRQDAVEEAAAVERHYPPLPPTTSKNRCARSRRSATGCKQSAATSWATKGTSTSNASSRPPVGCAPSSTTC